jgi:hypothetical protein
MSESDSDDSDVLFSSIDTTASNTPPQTTPLPRPSITSSSGYPTGSEHPSTLGYVLLGYDTGRLDVGYPQQPSAPCAVSSAGDITSLNKPFSDRARRRLERGRYFENWISIWIPVALTPLPSRLRESIVELMYFHHFMNHTARLMVAQDNEQNPFRAILPQSKLFSRSSQNNTLTASTSGSTGSCSPHVVTSLFCMPSHMVAWPFLPNAEDLFLDGRCPT